MHENSLPLDLHGVKFERISKIFVNDMGNKI